MKRQFTNRFNAPRLTPEQAERQGRASRMAVNALGSTEAIIAFLNTHDEDLGGRPIDLAVESEEGLLLVEKALQNAKAI